MFEKQLGIPKKYWVNTPKSSLSVSLALKKLHVQWKTRLFRLIKFAQFELEICPLLQYMYTVLVYLIHTTSFQSKYDGVNLNLPPPKREKTDKKKSEVVERLIEEKRREKGRLGRYFFSLILTNTGPS